jgi:putative glutathione S-transferase
MGLLVDGVWQDKWYDTTKSKGKFVRSQSQFRHWITTDGDSGPSGSSGFKAEPNRYHLYVSYACPWAHRALILRHLKGLEEMISVDVVHPLMLDHGWSFDTSYRGATGDRLYHSDYLHQIYTRVAPEITTRVTVPLLWDTQREMIVSNESSEIIRMFNSAFDDIGARELDLYPVALRPMIDDVNERVYHAINNGVYRSGFATTQEAYHEAASRLFGELDDLEEHLKDRDYLVGDQLTEADIRLAVTLFRFDLVYVQHFKLDRNRLIDYPNLWRHTRRIYQLDGIAETARFDHIREHYFRSHPTINPHRVIPMGPDIDWWAPLD